MLFFPTTVSVTSESEVTLTVVGKKSSRTDGGCVLGLWFVGRTCSVEDNIMVFLTPVLARPVSLGCCDFSTVVVLAQAASVHSRICSAYSLA